MNQTHLDPVSVAIALASVIFGPAMAAIVGPYAVIIIAATVGAAWALGRREQGSRLGAVWYFMLMNGTAVMVTVSLAKLAGRYLGDTDPYWLLAPIALVVGGVGEDWPKVGRWAFSRVARVFERRLSGGDKP
jgi:hypothetical protein